MKVPENETPEQEAERLRVRVDELEGQLADKEAELADCEAGWETES